MRSTTASLSRERKKRPGDESHHKDRGGRLRSTRARRRRTPVAATGRRRGTQALRAESPPTRMSYLKANPQQAPPKNNARREGIAQGPGPARPRRPLHTIERPANKAAPPKREADAVYPPQHARSALKNMSVECGKARLAVRGPLEDADAASRTLIKAPTPPSPTSVSKPSTTANDERPDHHNGKRHRSHRLDAL